MLFANDILIFSSNPRADIPHIQDIFTSFPACSGLRINFSKSEILPLYHPRFPPWANASPFTVTKQHITYLGEKIDKVPLSLYHLHFSLVFTKIIGELETWMGLPLLLLSRCHLFKMISFARLLYPLQTIPLLLRHIQVQRIHKALSNFLWHKRRPQISLLKLYLPRREGGANLPNLRLYNLFSLLRVCLDWLLQSSKYSNYDLTSQMTSPFSLPALLHCGLRSLPLNLKHNLLIRDT